MIEKLEAGYIVKCDTCGKSPSVSPQISAALAADRALSKMFEKKMVRNQPGEDIQTTWTCPDCSTKSMRIRLKDNS